VEEGMRVEERRCGMVEATSASSGGALGDEY